MKDLSNSQTNKGIVSPGYDEMYRSMDFQENSDEKFLNNRLTPIENDEPQEKETPDEF